MIEATFVVTGLLAMGAIGALTSWIGLTVGSHLADEPQGDLDTPMNRYAHTTYGGFAKRSTLVGGLVLLALGAVGAAVLLAAGQWTYQ